jgi:hypothetical protein
MIDNKQKTAVEWYAIEMYEYFRSMFGSGIINTDILEKAKEMENQQSQLYATFCLRCANENLPIIRFKDWINLEGGEQ